MLTLRRVYDFIDPASPAERQGIVLRILRNVDQLDMQELAAQAPMSLRALFVHFIRNMNVLPQAEAEMYLADIRNALPPVSMHIQYFCAIKTFV